MHRYSGFILVTTTHRARNLYSGICMMQHCKGYPGEDKIITFLDSLETCEVYQEIENKQWASTDRMTLVTIQEPISDFVNYPDENFFKFEMTSHIEGPECCISQDSERSS